LIEPRPLTEVEAEIRQSLLNAWTEILIRHAPDDYVELEGIELREALKSVFMMIGCVAGMMIAQSTDDQNDRAWLSQAVSMNIPIGIESRDRFNRSAKPN